ncbi:carbohydrate ABC transporter permease [Prosthecomicrobium sp. N25]|uniref:carbohydrate ABC transporter permease n=1 Tax=Prosthecomicrobium sp. N25 TaxID=3129254 RepID=UPI003077A029
MTAPVVGRWIVVAEPTGRRPRRLGTGRLLITAWLVVCLVFFATPLYLMISTSLKPMDEVRLGTMFHWPSAPSVVPWADAWLRACTGAVCRGLQPGFVNSVKLAVPSVLAMVAVGVLNGYALAFWRPWGSALMLNVTYVVAFIPYQVIVYPLVRLVTAAKLSNSVTAAVLVHVIYHMPLMTLLFFNYFRTVSTELFNAARVDGAGFWRLLVSIVLPVSLPAMGVAAILAVTVVWNDYQIALTFAGRANLPMTVQLAHLVESESGSKFYNIQMAATLLTSLVPLLVYFLSGRWFVAGLAGGETDRRGP